MGGHTSRTLGDASKGTNMSAKTGTFTIGDTSVEMPVKSGTIGPDVVDIGKLYDRTGTFTFDPGFLSTAACESKITYIDGDEGIPSPSI